VTDHAGRVRAPLVAGPARIVAPLASVPDARPLAKQWRIKRRQSLRPTRSRGAHETVIGTEARYPPNG
jgi:hypothetical protein